MFFTVKNPITDKETKIEIIKCTDEPNLFIIRVEETHCIYIDSQQLGELGSLFVALACKETFDADSVLPLLEGFEQAG